MREPELNVTSSRRTSDKMTFSTNLHSFPSSLRRPKGQNPANSHLRSVHVDRSGSVSEALAAARRTRHQSSCSAQRSPNSTLGKAHSPSWRLRARRVDSPILPPVIQLGRGAEVCVTRMYQTITSVEISFLPQEAMDLYSYLLRNRIVFLGGFVDFEMATKIVGSILALDALDSEEDIKLYINSPGDAFPCESRTA